MLVADRLRFRESGDPIPDGSEVTIRTIVGDALVGTATTSDGYFTFTSNGSPGAIYYTATVGSETFEHSSLSSGPARAVQIGELEELLTIVPDGIVDNVGSELNVTTVGVGLAVSVASGAVVRRGVIYRSYSAQTLTFVPVPPYNASTNTYPILVRFHDETSATPWKTEMFASGYPVANQPANPTGTVDITIATVSIAPGATSIASGNITNVTARAGDVTTADITDFGEAVWTAIKAHIQVGAGLTRTVNETDDTLTIAPSSGGVIDTEAIQDAVAAFIVAGSNITKTYNDAANTLTIASTGGSGSGMGAAYWDDTNFNHSGGLYGQRTLATATIEDLPAGTYFVECFTNFWVYGNGAGSFNTSLTGNGTPQGSEASSRTIDYSSGVWAPMILSGRRRLTIASTTDVSASVVVKPVSGSTATMGSGVVFLKAFREA